MIQSFIDGLTDYRKGIDAISRNGLWSYLVIPGLLSVLTAGLIFVGAILFSDDLGHWMVGIVPSWMPGKGFVEKILTAISFLITIGSAIFLFKYIVMIVAAPFMGPLSEKIESIITDKPAPPFSLKDAGSDILRTIRLSLRNIIREFFLILVLFILSFIIPVIGSIIYVVGGFLVQSYYAGFGNMDPTLERQRLKVKERVQFVRRFRWTAMGNGAVFILLALVPILGWFLAPAFGVASATFSALDRLKS